MMLSMDEKFERSVAVSKLQKYSSYLTDEQVSQINSITHECELKWRDFCKKGMVGQVCLENLEN